MNHGAGRPQPQPRPPAQSLPLWEPPTPTHALTPSPSQSCTGLPRGRHPEAAPPYIARSQSPLDSLTLAASVVLQQDVAGGAGAEVRAGLVHTLVLAEELGEAALIHVWG